MRKEQVREEPIVRKDQRGLGRDPLLLALALLATFVGLVLIFDAGYARWFMSNRGWIPREFLWQSLFAPLAIGLAALVARVRPERWQRLTKPLWILTLCSLVAVMIPGIGVEMSGAQRWIGYGSFTVQPAEFAKLGAILYIAGVLAGRSAWPKRIARRRDWAHWMDTVVVPKLARFLPGLWVLAAIVLIEKEPDLGTAAVIAVTAFAMFAVGGATLRSVLLASVIALGGAFFMVKQQPYRLERIAVHSQRWSAENMDDTGFQTVQSELAMASGGLIGTGIGSGRAKHILPATTTDFIFATVGEEFGLVGSLLLIGLLGGLTMRLLWLAPRAPTRFGSMVLFGVGVWIGTQTTVNVMMANGTLPAIGIPLPFISSGGSSLLALWLAIGVCQSMLARPLPVEQKEEQQSAADRHRRRNRRARLSRA
jgi:cell division protein FtsW